MRKYRFLFLLMMVVTVSFAQEQIVRDVSISQFKSGLDSLRDEVLIDLRTPDEIKHGMIENAIQLDYFRKDFEAAVAKLDHNKPYFLYCAVGGRSSEATELMKKLGFKQVYNLKDGFTGWKKHKMPFVVPKN